MIDVDFLRAGRAVFTVEPSADAVRRGLARHYTYRLAVRDAGTYVASLMTAMRRGRRVFTALGTYDLERGTIVAQHDTPPVRVLRRVVAMVHAGTTSIIEDQGWRLHHAGHCCRCGRLLTVPASVETGIGPECEAFVRLGLSVDTVPQHVPALGRLQYAYWMTGDRVALLALADAARDEGYSDDDADALASVTAATMRRYKKGAHLSPAFLHCIGVR